MVDKLRILVFFAFLFHPALPVWAETTILKDQRFATQPLLTAPGSSIDLALDLYLPSVPAAPHPVLVLCHGGSYATGDKRDVEGLAQDLAGRGVACVAINYRLGSVPDAGNETEAVSMVYQDVLAAFRWISKWAAKYQLDPDRVYVGGNSSGGHMAIATAVLFPLEISPPVRLRGAVDLYGGYFTENLSSRAIPLLILQGTADFTCLPEASRTMAGLYRNAGAWCRLILLEGMNHDWSHPAYRRTLVDLMAQFVDQTSGSSFAQSAPTAPEVLLQRPEIR